MSKIKTVLTRDTISGVVGSVPAHYLDHPILGKNLIEVPEGTKSFEPSMYKSKDKDGNEVVDDSSKPTTLEKIEEKIDGKPSKPTLDLENR